MLDLLVNLPRAPVFATRPNVRCLTSLFRTFYHLTLSDQSFFSALKVYILGTNSGLRMADLKLWLVATLYNMKRLCQVLRQSLSPTRFSCQYDPRRPYFVGCPSYLHLQYMVSLRLFSTPRHVSDSTLVSSARLHIPIPATPTRYSPD